MAINTPNMNLSLPIIGVDTGLTWEQSINSNTDRIDQHNHTPGNGAVLGTASITIDSDLSLNANNLIEVRAVRFGDQPSVFLDPTDKFAVYVVDGDLYYNNGTPTPVQITLDDAVNATTSSISSPPASAGFVGTTLVVLAGPNVPGNIQAGSILIGNNIAGSQFITLSAPNPLTTSYPLVLPPLPSALQGTSLINLAPISGEMGIITYDGVGQAMSSVGANAIGVNMTSTGANAIGQDMTATGANAIGVSMTATGANAIGVSMMATGANAIANSRTRATGAVVPVGGVAVSAPISFSTSATTPQNTGLTVTITTSAAGRPVMLMLQSSGSSGGVNHSCVLTPSLIIAEVAFSRSSGGGVLSQQDCGPTNGSTLATPISSFSHVDTPPGNGTYVYTVQLRRISITAGTVTMNLARLIAYEL